MNSRWKCLDSYSAIRHCYAPKYFFFWGGGNLGRRKKTKSKLGSLACLAAGARLPSHITKPNLYIKIYGIKIF